MSNSTLPTPFKLGLMGKEAIKLLESCFDLPADESWNFSAWGSERELPEEGRETLRQLLAELAFWQRLACPDKQALLPDWLHAIRPFADSDANLGELLPLASQAAMAVFPLAGQAGHPPAPGRLYLLKGRLEKDSRHRLEFVDRIPEDCALLVSGHPTTFSEKIAGNSWQLAAALAQRAIDEPGLRLPLGMGWFCSGAVDERGVVKPVRIGNKAELTWSSTRRWLLPEEAGNFAEWKRKAEAGAGGFAVRKLGEALIYIGESGIMAYQFAFPKSVDELHILIGESPLPVLAVCMQLFPKQVCLWHSEQTRLHAGALQQVLEGMFTVKLHDLPSDNMATVEVRIRERLQENAGSKRLINITGGNRMMGFAAMLAARHCQVQIVYRDIDAEEDQLEMIDFADDPNLLPRNGKVKGNNCRSDLQDKVNWQRLYGRQMKPKTGNSPNAAWLWEVLWKEGMHPRPPPAKKES